MVAISRQSRQAFRVSCLRLLPLCLLAAASVVVSARPASAAKVRLTIVTEPPGANLEWNGRFVGTTPFTTEMEDYTVKPPRWIWSNFLNESIILRVWKDGFIPKTVEITSGPFEWVNTNNTARKIFYIVRTPDVRVRLERDPRATTTDSATSPAAAPRAASTVTGTGFILAAGYVATNYHVVRDADHLEIRVPGQSAALAARTVVKDAGNDLAILKVDGAVATNNTPIMFAEAPGGRVGQDIFTLGYPLGALMGGTVRLSTGTLDSLFGIDDDPRVYQISNPVQPGNSGGPLFNRDGQLIGIVVAQLDAKVLYEAVGIIPQNVNFAVKATFLRNLIETLPEAATIAKQTNKLAGLPRDQQVEALTPSVVQIVNHRHGSSTQDSPRNAAASASTGPPSIEGQTRDQVMKMLGPPSLTETNTDGVTLWYYDTAQGTLKVYFYQDRASLRRQR